MIGRSSRLKGETVPYQCDRCGACCRKLIIEIEMLDIAREPKLALHADPFLPDPDWEPDDGEEYQLIGPLVPGFEHGANLNSGPSFSCPMLSGNEGSIYPTRPNCCVAMQAGSDQCQSARRREKLPLLEPC